MEVASVKGQTKGQVETLLNKKTDPSLEKLFSLPEKVLQFGTGVLLRGLPDYFIDKANKNGIFNGRIVVVKSTDSGDSSVFSKQDNLYTLCVRGVDDGSLIEEDIICASISRVLSAKSEWNEVLKCASNPELEIIISNTTEVGIELVQDDITQNPPISFPGKVLAFLYERYRHFDGAPDKGMVIVPTELIPDNGKKLESIVIELAHRNGLEGSFIDWMEQSNYFCNSLVDRIVPGTPNSDMKARIEETLGYKDNLLTVSEVYRLWAIEGNEKVKEVLSFATADEGVIIEPSIEIYRELKLRLLNGAHTLTCGLAYLSGINTVRDGMENEELASFMRNLMLGEIAPSIPYKVDEKAARRFALRTYERFQNKHIEHQWINITAQYSSKMKMRNLPLLLNYYKIFESVPAYFALGFSAYLLFMKGVKKENGKIYGKRGDEFYVINDSMAEYFYEKWQSTDPTKIVNEVLKDKAFWGSDLTLLSGLSEKVNVWLKRMLEVGVAEALHQFSSRG
jgi:tagaturonate reductase